MFLLAIAFVAYAQTVPNIHCDRSAQALNRYEQMLLAHADDLDPKKPSDLERIEVPLRCLVYLQQQGQGLAKYLAEKYLNPFMGAGQISGIPLDHRYRNLSRFLEAITLQAPDPLHDSIVAQYAKGDWDFYEMICEQGDTSFCSLFLPNDADIKHQQPLMAAAGLMRLRKAYQVTSGKQRDLIAGRLRSLYREIPKSAKLQRRFIEQIYNELFTAQPLSMV